MSERQDNAPPAEANNSDYPSIKLKKLVLHNIKCFEHAEFSFDDNGIMRPWTLLVGNNGVGKTTILHAIALCSFGPDLASKITPLPQNMLRVGAKEGYMKATFKADFSGKGQRQFSLRLVVEKGNRTFTVKLGGNVLSSADFIDNRKRTDFEGWFVAGYGPVRNLLFTDEPSKLAPKDPVIDRLESLFDPTKLLIDPNSLYRFLSGDTSPFKEMGAPAELDSTTINQIRELLDKLLPMISFKSPNGSGSLETPFGKVPISELSEGYKSMLSWLAHLIIHLLAANQWHGDINKIKGIVLIDEVDLHLHPSWQQRVIPLLRESFPNLQFIGTTHSPMTVGGVSDGDIVLLEQQEGNIQVKQDLPSIKGWRADQILTGPLFGLQSTRDLTTQAKMNRYTELLGKTTRTPEEQKQFEELEAILGQTLPPSGETEAQREAFKLIEKTMQDYFNNLPPDKKAGLLEELKVQLQL